MRDQITQKIEAIFRAVFDVEDLVINNDLTAEEVELWDSLSHMEMITTVEEAFDIVIPFDKVIAFKTVGDLIDHVLQTQN